MERLKLAADKVSAEVDKKLGAAHRRVVEEVASAVAREPVVIVGMAQNPFVKRARKLLEGEGVKFTYLEYGSYFSQWQERLAIKLWAGFPTFPMIFINGTLEGGFTDLERLRDEGKLKRQA